MRHRCRFTSRWCWNCCSRHVPLETGMSDDKRKSPSRQFTSRQLVNSLAKAGILAVALLVTSSPVGHASGKGRESKALLWSAPGGTVTCGIANHVGGGPLQLLCAARSIPPPKHADPTIGDPGFVYLKAHQRPRLARLSQYSWQKGRNYGESNKATALRSGTRWKQPGLAVTCAIRKRAVRCRNSEGHGFVIRRGSYRGF